MNKSKWANDMFENVKLHMRHYLDGVFEFYAEHDNYDIVTHIMPADKEGKMPASVPFTQADMWNHVLIRDEYGDVMFETSDWKE